MVVINPVHILLCCLLVGAMADCAKPTTGSLVLAGGCSQNGLSAAQQWHLSSGTATIKLASNDNMCMDFNCDQKPCFVNGKYGPDAIIKECSSASPQFTVHPNRTITLVFESKVWCLDLRSDRNLQAYPCVGTPNQKWSIKAASSAGGTFIVSSTDTCMTACQAPPPPANPFCPQYHPIHDRSVYDPSGPLLDSNGLWHTWEDHGSWSHWTSKDLIHWNGSFSASTHFGGDTGSVSPTPSGVYAFWPIMGGKGKGSIGSAKSLDPTQGLNSWQQRGATIPMPARINTGYRDPVRAFEYGGKWYVGVGCGNKAIGAQFCLFEAEDDTLAKFTDQGSLYSTNVTFGEVDGNQVWQPNNVSANMMECPDLFPLGDSWVLIGSLYKTNQWWVGDLSGTPPRFTPRRVGILDYGNGYAAKTGTTMVQSGDSRRLVFGFTGWSEPTMPKGCGRSLIIPRELSLRKSGPLAGQELVISPINETQVLRVPSSHVSLTSPGALAMGSQVEVRMRCSGPVTTLHQGKVGVRTLATKDGKQYTEIGYDFEKQAMYADHSKCCGDGNTIVQRAPLVLQSGVVELAVFVDGGLIEAFANGRVITPLVAPDPTSAAPEDRVTTMFDTTGKNLECAVDSWQLKY